MKTLIHTAIMACLLPKLAVAYAGYFYAYSACKGNIFLNFGKNQFCNVLPSCIMGRGKNKLTDFESTSLSIDPSDSVVIVGRIGIGLTIMFAATLSTLPCREAFLSLIPQIQTWWKEPAQDTERSEYVSDMVTNDSDPPSSVHSQPSAGEQIESEMSAKEGDPQESTCEGDESTAPGRNPIVHFVTSVFIEIYVFSIAVSVPGVAVVWSVIGSSLGMIIGFIIPCACYLKIRGKKGTCRSTNLGALALMIFSVVIAIVCSIQTIMAPIKE